MSSPTATHSLQQRQAELSSPRQQHHLLNQVDLSNTSCQGNFDAALTAHGWETLTPAPLEIFQINIGKLCNMTCRHCHVDAGPDRKEIMSRDTIEACLRVLDQTTAHTVDITGGAPELNPHFRYLVDQCVMRGKHIIDRCNLTVLLLPTMEDLPAWLAERGVEIVCSLPCYLPSNTDTQRGDGAFDQSIAALKQLNAVGYGQSNPTLKLTLVSNPIGTSLAPQQRKLEQAYRTHLLEQYGVTFDRLIALNNMPISRHLEWLEQSGQLQAYMELLVNAFNPSTIQGLMCRNTLSISWDGRLFDCDFNQMLELELHQPNQQRPSIHNVTLEQLTQRHIVTGRHCFGCTAGTGSSCGGAIA